MKNKELNIQAIRKAFDKFLETLTVEEVESWIKDNKQTDHLGQEVIYVECNNKDPYDTSMGGFNSDFDTPDMYDKSIINFDD